MTILSFLWIENLQAIEEFFKLEYWNILENAAQWIKKQSGRDYVMVGFYDIETIWLKSQYFTNLQIIL